MEMIRGQVVCKGDDPEPTGASILQFGMKHNLHDSKKHTLLLGVMKGVLGVLALFVASTESTVAQDVPQRDVVAKEVTALMEEARIEGVAIALISKGEVAWTLPLGVRSRVNGAPVTDDTIFEAALLSKPVVAYLAHALRDAGLFDLDRPLADYLGYDRNLADPRLFEVSARTALMHSTGFPNWRPAGGDLLIEFDPGTAFLYSGEGFVFLQLAIEEATGRKLESLASEFVFEPLGMTSSSFLWQESFAEHLAVAHDSDGNGLDKFTPTEANAAFSLHTTASDYATFLLALAGGEGLSSESRMALTSPQMSAEAGIYWSEGMGLEPRPEGQALWHWGDQGGYRAFAYVTPNAGEGMVYFSNSENGMLILDRLYDLLLSGPATSIAWLNYESLSDPGYKLGRRLLTALADGGVEAAYEEYDAAQADLPEEAFVEESLNTLGYKLLRQNRVDEAIAMFELNTVLFPESYNVYDSLGEAWYAKGDLEKSLSFYRRSVLINPANESGKSMIVVIRDRLAEIED